MSSITTSTSTSTSTRTRRLLAVGAITTVALGGVAAGGVAAAQAAAAPHHLSTQQIDDRVEQSIVDLEIDYAGSVAYQTVDNRWVWSTKPLAVAFGCTGWFADATGDIVTAGHCLDRKSGRAALVDAYIEQLAKDPSTGIDAAWVKENAAWAETNWKVEGSDGTSTIDQTVSATQSGTLEHPTLTKPTAASVIAVRPVDKEDVALVNVDVRRSVPLPIAERSPGIGSAVTLVGFPGSVSEVVNSATLAPSFKTGTVSSRQTNENGVAKLEVNADISHGMSGGPAIDAEGRVVGINSFEINGETKNFNFVTDTDSMASFLHRQMLHSAPRFDTWIDTKAIAATTSTFSLIGAAVLLMGIVAGVLLGLRRRPVSRPKQTGPDASSPAPAPAPVVPGTGRDGVPLDTAPIMVPESFLSRCTRGHVNSADAVFCSTCGTSIDHEDRAIATA